jgi:hypothetical protein
MHKPIRRPEHHSFSREGERRQFALVLRQTPDCTDPIRALRWILKSALRAHHMRCVSIMEVPGDEHHANEELTNAGSASSS